MSARALVLAAAFLALAACATPEQRAARAEAQLAADKTECTRLGFTAGTEAFSNCLLKLREIRAEEARARAVERANDRWMWGPHWSRWPYHYRRPYW